MTVLAPYRALLAVRLFLCVPAQSSVQAVQRDVTSISLRRIDRACYQDRCDVHSDTTDDTYSPTRRDAKRSRREPQEGVHTASRSSDRRARSMPASAWRTPWTVAKPKTPAVAVRWRERRRSSLTLRADDPTSRGTTQPNHNPTQHETTLSRFSRWISFGRVG